MSSSSLQELTAKVVAFRDARDWKQFHNPKDCALSLVLEATELLEIFQWKNGVEVEAVASERKKEIADELADVVYWALLIAHDQGIDLAKAMRDKMAENEQRYPADKARGTSKKYTEL
ncbi:nucleotide pyrophosphohydrolase [Ramlibacter albus]|uniref:Nucleotide pyrophosphohydrolase n=1 Tax=Ramlibacter albus TaxID=2079448 RepID=A0A923S293_9BURK|nr:nucleotide pyrophosphohydrolase [Ramlibacter albus]MBC5765125.1 nucleotide pyrophosphohydrolase [Ramlibacter albus]